MYHWLQSLVYPDPSSYTTLKWLAADAAYCIALKSLRIPRLNYAFAVVLLQIFVLWFVDGLLFGSVQVSIYVMEYRIRCKASDRLV